jgi:hypothetical protein
MALKTISRIILECDLCGKTEDKDDKHQATVSCFFKQVDVSGETSDFHLYQNHWCARCTKEFKNWYNDMKII